MAGKLSKLFKAVVVALGIIESEISNSIIQCDVYIFQLLCLSPRYGRFFDANKGYLPLTNCG